jgi:RNA polymerase sigma-70 factor (ECF subfamily)
MESFAEIYKKYYRKVYYFLLKLSCNDNIAEELTQQVFYNAFVHIGSFREKSSLLTWLCAIAKNEWLLECRRNKHYISEEMEESSYKTNGEGIVDFLIYKDLKKKLRKEILTMPEIYRDILILHVYADISLNMIAKDKGKSESWARVTYYRAKEYLSMRMEE